jgi:hypothetical protein
MITILTDKSIAVNVPADANSFGKDNTGDLFYEFDVVENENMRTGRIGIDTLPEGNWMIIGKADQLNMDQIYEIIKGTGLSLNKLLESKIPNLDKRTILILRQP